MSKEVVTMAGTDAMHERIAAHPWPRGGVEVIRANRGDTLYGRRTGGQVARLRPTGENDDVQILWWRGAGWATPGDFGPLIMPLNEALNFVATESFFWIGAYPSKRHEMCKLKLRSAGNARRLVRSSGLKRLTPPFAPYVRMLGAAQRPPANCQRTNWIGPIGSERHSRSRRGCCRTQ